MAAPSGMRFGRYEALFRVAQGGMAEVFAGRIRAEAGFERLVAVKRMLPHLAADERFVGMFLDEARLAAAVSSSHVVPTLDLGRDAQGSPYIVLQLVVGASLSQLMQRAVTLGPLVPLPVALEILAQTGLGLHHAHEALTASGEPLALVHRDVSPQNILVSASGAVLVSDFGIAKGAIARLADTNTGGLKGKLAYLSPEQARGDEVD
ncbi:MAG: serine/threonine protein kinase, partial [Myxococcales bacterium]|nr:serine/threonine protein kinase [Myxococcales bacterium]